MIKKNLEMEEKILCISRANMYLPKALFVAKKDFLKNIMNNRILLHSQMNYENSFMNLNSFQKSDKNMIEKKPIDQEEDYKNKLYSRMGIEGFFDIWQYCNHLKKKNKTIQTQIENKKNDIEYMLKRMKL